MGQVEAQQLTSIRTALAYTVDMLALAQLLNAVRDPVRIHVRVM